MLFALGLSLVDLNDNHRIRELDQSAAHVLPPTYDIGQAFKDWIVARPDRADFQTYPVYVVAAEGGGIYAAYHAALFLAAVRISSRVSLTTSSPLAPSPAVVSAPACSAPSWARTGHEKATEARLAYSRKRQKQSSRRTSCRGSSSLPYSTIWWRTSCRASTGSAPGVRSIAQSRWRHLSSPRGDAHSAKEQPKTHLKKVYLPIGAQRAVLPALLLIHDGGRNG